MADSPGPGPTGAGRADVLERKRRTLVALRSAQGGRRCGRCAALKSQG